MCDDQATTRARCETVTERPGSGESRGVSPRADPDAPETNLSIRIRGRGRAHITSQGAPSRIHITSQGAPSQPSMVGYNIRS
eukprot:7390124-Prymnesium_polylepis.2